MYETAEIKRSVAGVGVPEDMQVMVFDLGLGKESDRVAMVEVRNLGKARALGVVGERPWRRWMEAMRNSVASLRFVSFRLLMKMITGLLV